MENSKYPESLLLMLKLNLFFRVKDCDYIQEHEVTGEVLHLPQSKRAEINDFKEIFEREFENSNLEDNRENRKYWTGILIDDIQAKKELYIELTKDNPKIGRSHGTILMAESFIKYLKKFAAPELKVKPFSEYFVPKNQNELAEICKSIFNKNDSPKDYAIMLCLISQRGFVVILDKKRKDFFAAWYRYINRPLPKRSNFTAINKFMYEKIAIGFVFKNEDTDYYSLERAFDKALKNSGI